ncbi:hypothetical protein VX037_12845 [Gordonia sp. Z-3]|uniref:Uncharacterized protein n=2 Tax=Gordonia TaxID=2053 RepID=A0A9X3D631_9ACTN|nr:MULTISPECIES: hypothetical protein [Gordonia]MCF3939504.1 hypothetical protein [Gordonia tangerina]MCX2964312.1 hypothetical protein [Gordonia aquimaris]MED5801918.1 hypothetical protein [Gordonia sp. Z-3]
MPADLGVTGMSRLAATRESHVPHADDAGPSSSTSGSGPADDVRVGGPDLL